MLLFVHFGMNTFTDRDWGDGTEAPSQFNPTDVNPRQWARVAKEAGFKGLIFTAKHHEGFALWPSRYTDFSVANSPWRNGEGDVVRAVAEACRKEGIKFGIYLSPWDRHEPSYGTPAYNDFYVNQLTELLTGYGPVFEVWMDGAHGDGVNPNYDFERFWATVREHQPGAVIAIAGPDVRWVGNERGVARETEWSARGDRWYPAECDLPNRPRWFWVGHLDDDVMSLERHLDVYFTSVGRNCTLLLNVPPNRDGVIPEPDVRRLMEMRAVLDAIFDEDLATYRPSTASNVREDSVAWGPEQAVDPRPGTFWATDDDTVEAWIEIDLEEAKTFNVIELKEPIAYGQRVEAYRVEAWRDGAWETVARGTTIGYRKLDRPGTVTARRVRLVIESSRAAPAIERFGLYFGSDVPEPSE